MSLNFNNSAANILNTPGFISDDFANRPAANFVAIGTIFIATDTGAIYQSDGSAWSSIGGGGSSQNLDQVLNVGNTSTETIQLYSGGDSVDIAYNNIYFNSPGIAQTFIENAPTQNFKMIDNNSVEAAFNTAGLEFLNSATDIDFRLNNGAGGFTALRFNNTIINTFFNNNNAGLKLDYNNLQYYIGDYDGANKSNYLIIDDNSEEIKTIMAGVDTGIFVDRVSYCKIGDYNGNLNVNYMEFDNVQGFASIYTNTFFNYIQDLRYDDGGTGALLSGSAGGNSGQHLIIKINGTTYKIALNNP